MAILDPLRYLALNLATVLQTSQSSLDLRWHDLHNGIIFKLFLILLAACIGTAIAGSKRIAIPLVVAEILAGAVIGKSGLNWLQPDADLTNWSTVGFAILLFLVGTNLPLRDPKIRGALNMGILATGLAYLFAIPAAIVVARATNFPHVGILILLVACSSTSIVLRVINERKLSGPGLTMTTTWIPIADMSTLAALPLAMSHGKASGVILGTLAVTAVGYMVLVSIKKFESSNFGTYYKRLSKQRNWAWQMKYHLCCLFGLCVLSQLVGVTSTIVAGFVMGATVTLVGVPGRFSKQLLGLGEGLFVPLFFVTLGAKIDIRALFTSVHNMELAVFIAAGALVVHLLVAKLVKLPLSSGFMAASSMGLPAAIVSAGLSDNIITPGQAAAIIAAALISLVFAAIGVSQFERANPVKPKGKKPKIGHEPLHLPTDSPEPQAVTASGKVTAPMPSIVIVPQSLMASPALEADEPSVTSTHEIGT